MLPLFQTYPSDDLMMDTQLIVELVCNLVPGSLLIYFSC